MGKFFCPFTDARIKVCEGADALWVNISVCFYLYPADYIYGESILEIHGEQGKVRALVTRVPKTNTVHADT